MPWFIGDGDGFDGFDVGTSVDGFDGVSGYLL